jgi:hypothetical protein
MPIKPGGNLKRPGGGYWNLDVFNTCEPTKNIPEKGWCLVAGKTSVQSTLFLDGNPVRNVSEVDYKVVAGEMPVLTLKIIMPEWSTITQGDIDEC